MARCDGKEIHGALCARDERCAIPAACRRGPPSAHNVRNTCLHQQDAGVRGGISAPPFSDTALRSGPSSAIIWNSEPNCGNSSALPCSSLDTLWDRQARVGAAWQPAGELADDGIARCAAGIARSRTGENRCFHRLSTCPLLARWVLPGNRLREW